MGKAGVAFDKRLFFSTIAILVALLSVTGYCAYRFYIAPGQVKLAVPTVSYPRSSVYYRYSLQLNGLTARFGGQNMPLTSIGAVVEKDMERIKSNGFGGVRIGYSFQGNNYVSDQAAVRAAQQGMYPIGMLQGSQNMPTDRAFTPTEMKSWLAYVRDEVSANKDIVYFWDIWGEPSLNKYGTPAEFVQLLKVTYPVIKQANPNARVIVTLGADGRNTGFEDQVLALGGGDYFDVLSFHPYGANPYLQEGLVKEAIAYEQATVSKYNNRWPLVISEIGQPASEVSETEQARLAAFLYAETAKSTIPVSWFYWSDERLPRDEATGDGANWGLIRNDGTERPSLAAIKPYLTSNSSQ